MCEVFLFPYIDWSEMNLRLTPLWLAAHASLALDETPIEWVRVFEEPSDDFAQAVIGFGEREALVRMPLNQSAETVQSGELLGYTALSAGMREMLPFQVPQVLGVAPAEDTRIAVLSLLGGRRAAEEEFARSATLLQSAQEAISAIHALPVASVRAAALPVETPETSRANLLRLLQQTAQTRLLPSTVEQRWKRVLQRAYLWDYDPCPIHGSLSEDQIRVIDIPVGSETAEEAEASASHTDSFVCGILGFDRFRVGDPAEDFVWLIGCGRDVFLNAVTNCIPNEQQAERLIERADLLHEMQIARWLLYGIETHQQAVIDDAITMFDHCVDRLRHAPETAETPITLSEAYSALQSTPEITRVRSLSEAFDGFEDDAPLTRETQEHEGPHPHEKQEPHEKKQEPQEKPVESTEKSTHTVAEALTEGKSEKITEEPVEKQS